MSKQLIINRLLHYKSLKNNVNQEQNNLIKSQIAPLANNESVEEVKRNIIEKVKPNVIENIISIDENPLIKEEPIFQVNNKKKVLFINFKPDNIKAYGGGNISTHYLQKHFGNKYSNFEVTYKLIDNDSNIIDIYLMIDPFKDNRHKKFNLSDIINHRNKYNPNSKIVYRVNDCDITRPTLSSEYSREKYVIQNIDNIDIFVFNSNFVKTYYFEKYGMVKNKLNFVVHNGASSNTFYGSENYNIINISSIHKIKIVTHHWSDNMFKGYQTYYDLWKYCKGSYIFEFVFIGKNIPEMFKDVPVIGPLHSEQVGNKLRDCHIYITDSKYDSCPNHVIEAIMCELPILYTSSMGGGNELCSKLGLKIGEEFNSFEDLIIKLHKISENYSFYKNNLIKAKNYYKIENCIDNYNIIFAKIVFNNKIFERNVTSDGDKIFITFDFITTSQVNKACILINDKKHCFISNGTNGLLINDSADNVVNIKIISDKGDTSIENFKYSNFCSKKNVINNNKNLNIMYSSDYDYFVGLFASLSSIIKNTSPENLNNTMFNFMIPIKDSEHFTNMYLKLLENIKTNLNKTVVYIDDNIVPNEIIKSKCYNGGKHLLNIGNFSRLLIGELFSYSKLLYLDADSIIQGDIHEKLLNFNLEKEIYAVCADKQEVEPDKHMVLKLGTILNKNYNGWKNIIGKDIDFESNSYMGVPFLTNCKYWSNVYKKMIEIVDEHNKTNGGIYKLFTMSLFNILFYNKFGNLETIIPTLADLGSKRKNWSKHTIEKASILDWSGVFKPWFANGLYKNKWQKYDILNLERNYYDVNIDEKIIKEKTENFKHTDFERRFIDLNFSDINLLPENMKSLQNSKEINRYIHSQIKKGCNSYYTSIFIHDAKFRKIFINDEMKNNKKINILCIVDINHFITKMSRVRFWAYEELIDRNDVNFIYFGPGWKHWKNNLTLQENIYSLNINFDFVEWYKPLDCNFGQTKMIYPTCIRYNEMWNEEWTRREIDNSQSDLIICHHKNDQEKYEGMYNDIDNKKSFVYIPHHANPNIFYNTNTEKDIDILISGVLKEKHYPLKTRLFNLIMNNKNTVLGKYKIHLLKHPGYSLNTSFENSAQTEYSKLINRSKICIACTSAYNYRLGKYVEISMCGSVICGDIPYEDKDNFKKFVIEVTLDMSDEEILSKIIYYLENNDLLVQMGQAAEKWAQQHTTKNYSDSLLNEMILYKKNMKKKIFIISDEIKKTHVEFKGEKWICDVLKEEFMNYYPEYTTENALEADVIWYLAPWNYKYLPSGFNDLQKWYDFIKTKDVVATLHHFDLSKFGEYIGQFGFMEKYATRYHAICEKTYNAILNLEHTKPIYKEFLWINDNIFYNMKNRKRKVREKYNFSKDSFLVGSFQKDTEGKSNLPKLSKGPDIFISIVENMKKRQKNLEVVLTGLRRDYVIAELEKRNIKYHYFNMAQLSTLNELYCCLDVYIVSSRCEGGPRSIFEAGLTMTPIISTDVGIASDIMPRESLYNMENPMSYKCAVANPTKLYDKVKNLKMNSQIKNILDMLIGKKN